jgi:hypothetical protein
MIPGVRRFYRRLRHGRPIVVVSGLPRSGTSMVMKMLEEGGMPIVTDGVRTADEDNPRGYYEDERVKDLARVADKSWLKGARGRAVKIISYLLKELPPANNYKVLFVRRDLREILSSQAKMLARRGEVSHTTDTRMVELYESDLWKAASLLKRARQFETLEVQYKEVLDHAEEQARRIREFVGLPLDVARMAGVVDRQLYRNRAGAAPN